MVDSGTGQVPFISKNQNPHVKSEQVGQIVFKALATLLG
jgi:hypothetical protein